jgi:hypothetical protein
MRLAASPIANVEIRRAGRDAGGWRQDILMRTWFMKSHAGFAPIFPRPAGPRVRIGAVIGPTWPDATPDEPSA